MHDLLARFCGRFQRRRMQHPVLERRLNALERGVRTASWDMRRQLLVSIELEPRNEDRRAA